MQQPRACQYHHATSVRLRAIEAAVTEMSARPSPNVDDLRKAHGDLERSNDAQMRLLEKVCDEQERLGDAVTRLEAQLQDGKNQAIRALERQTKFFSDAFAKERDARYSLDVESQRGDRSERADRRRLRYRLVFALLAALGIGGAGGRASQHISCSAHAAEERPQK